MQFQVPQFIDVEDKIFGPLSFKQFLYVIGGIGGCFVLYRFLPGFVAIPLIILVGGLAAALAFYKINNRPFIVVLEAAFRYFTTTRLYVWRREYKKPSPKEEAAAPTAPPAISRLSDSKLKELSWALDVKKDRNGE